jgi:hypothetical protein
MAGNSKVEPFVVKDCALAAIATGMRAQNLRELRDGLLAVHPESINYHFWGGLLQPRFDDSEYNNDFASWARHALHDNKLGERLGVIDPADFHDIEALRQELIDVIETRLDEMEFHPWARRDQQFHFVRAQIVVFDTGKRILRPRDLRAVVPTLSIGSIYYHVIDARRREPQRVDDIRAWLQQFGDQYAVLCDRLAGLDPYFITLTELRRALDTVIAECPFDGGAA